MNDVSSLDGWKIAELAMGALLAGFLWIFRRLQSKVDASVSKDDFKEALELLRKDYGSMNMRNQTHLQRIEDKLDGVQHTGVIVTRIDRHDSDIEDLRTWKHQVDPFIKRRVDP